MKRVLNIAQSIIMIVGMCIFFNTSLFISTGEYATFDGSSYTPNKMFSNKINILNMVIRIVMVLSEIYMIYMVKFGLIFIIIAYIIRPIAYMFIMDSDIDIYTGYKYKHIVSSYSIETVTLIILFIIYNIQYIGGK